MDHLRRGCGDPFRGVGQSCYEGVRFFNVNHQSGRSGQQSSLLACTASHLDEATTDELKSAWKATRSGWPTRTTPATNSGVPMPDFKSLRALDMVMVRLAYLHNFSYHGKYLVCGEIGLLQLNRVAGLGKIAG